MKIHYINCIETNKEWGAENFINESFIQLGHEVINTDYRKKRNELAQIFSETQADILLIQRGDWIDPTLISSVKYPKILWETELVSRNRREVYYNAHAFDHIFVRGPGCKQELADNGLKKTDVMLSGFHPPVHRNLNLEKEYDILFVGLLNDRRKRILEEFSKNFEVTYFSVFGDEMVREINKAKIVLNLHYADGINDTETRVYEVLGCGQFLITEKLSMPVFQNGKHMVECENEKDMKEKIAFYLKNKAKREEIAENGFKEVISKHTYFQRAQQLTKKMEEIKTSKKYSTFNLLPVNLGILYNDRGERTQKVDEFYNNVANSLSNWTKNRDLIQRELQNRILESSN